MKLLFTARPLTGHVYPLLPSLARAASARGHEVAFATGAPMLDDLRRRGLTAFAAGLGDEGRREFHRRFPALATLPPDAQRALFWGELFAGIELGPRLASLGAIIRGWRPDVIVHDVAELAAPIAATAAGIPYATAGFGLTIPAELVTRAAAAAAPHWRAHGLDAPPRAGLYQHLYLDPCPISLRAGQLENMPRQPIRLTANGGEPPRWLAALPRPVVYLTLGSVWNTDHALFSRVLDATQALPISVVVTLGRDADPEALGQRPPHVHVHGFIPQEQLLPASAAVVSHAGAGTLLGALAHGLPLLLLPQGADQFLNAARAARAGAALRLLPHERSATTIRNAVVTLLDDPSLHRAARRIRDELESMPGPHAAIQRLETLPQTTEPRLHTMHAPARRRADGLEHDGARLALDGQRTRDRGPAIGPSFQRGTR